MGEGVMWEEGGGNLVVAKLWGRGDVFVFRG